MATESVESKPLDVNQSASTNLPLEPQIARVDIPSTEPSVVNTALPPMVLVYVATTSLKTYPRQIRKHTQNKIQRLAKFIQQSGVIIPLVVDKDNFVILGNARLAALKHLGVDSVPVIRATHLNDAMIRALIIADNQFCLNADWYKAALKQELMDLAPLVLEFGLELTDLGFETPQLDLIIGDLDLSCITAETEIAPESRAVTQQGHLWLMGQHKLVCGDARAEDTYEFLMGDERAEMVFGDLPYNVPITGHVCGNGAIQHREFAMGAGEMTEEQFIAFMVEIFALLRKFSKDGSISMQCMDWRHGFEILTAARQVGYEYLNMACWVKHVGGMGSLLRSQHELVHIFKSGTAPHINNVMLGKYGRNRTNVWQYDGANSFSASRKGDLALHSTTKPVDMVADAIKDCSSRGGIILDPTAGAGSTLIAAEQTNRVARLIEIDPHYCDVIVRRWQNLTGKKAILASTEQSFDELRVQTEVPHGDEQ